MKFLPVSIEREYLESLLIFKVSVTNEGETNATSFIAILDSFDNSEDLSLDCFNPTTH